MAEVGAGERKAKIDGLNTGDRWVGRWEETLTTLWEKHYIYQSVLCCVAQSATTRYRFRVKAVNKLGQSLPCDMKGGAIVIKVSKILILRMTDGENAVRASCWSKATTGCTCCRIPEICFRFRFFSSKYFPTISLAKPG